MALGQAFVEVHADLTPFRRDLNRELQRITRDFERELERVLTVRMRTVAGQAGTQAGASFTNNFTRRTQRDMAEGSGIWVTITSGLVNSLERGLSSLPPQVQAALVTGVLAAAPLVAGAISAAISAGAGLAVVGIGVALASQFQSVQDGWQSFISRARTTLVSAAGAFETVLLRVFDIVNTRIDGMSPRIERIFDTAATFVEPFVNRLLDAVDVFLRHVDQFIGGTGGFVEELGNAFVILADAAGLALRILVDTGVDGRNALRDLATMVGGLLVGFSLLLNVLTRVYGLIRGTARVFAEAPWLVQVLFPIGAGFGHVINMTDQMATANETLAHTNVNLTQSQDGVIAKTKEEEQALKALQTAINAAADAALAAITSNVSYEASIDNLAEALKKGGKNLNIDTEAGRKSVQAFADSIGNLRKQLLDRVATGEITSQQAVAQYNREIERLEALANQAGITDEKFYELFGTAINLGELEISPETSGLDDASASAEELIARLKEVIRLAAHLGATTIGGALAGARRGLAAGDIVRYPETIDVAEEGPEAVIPLTKPARAAQLMRQSGLDKMFSSGTQVLVFIDGQQMEARMVRVAHGVSAAQGMALSHGFRGV